MLDEATGAAVLQVVKGLRVRRLCHFTRLESLRLMVEDRCIKPSAELAPDLVNDASRFDAHHGYVCLSVTYPNVFLLNQFAGDDVEAWCVLMLRPDLFAEPGIRFCPINAATANGRYVRDGPQGVQALFEEEIRFGNRPSKRNPRQPRSVPTDNQAEVLFPGRVPLAFVFEIVAASDAGRERVEATLKHWPSTRETPKPGVRLEERMFRPEVYWELKLFSDPLPPVPFDEGT